MRAWAVVVVGALLWTTTAARVRIWTDETEVWRSATAVSPHKPRPWVNYGKRLALTGHPEMADFAYREALRVSVRRPEAERRSVQFVAGVNRALLAVETDPVRALALITTVREQFPTMPQVAEVYTWIASRQPSH